MVEGYKEVASFAAGDTTLPGREAIEAYRRDGVICLRRAFGPEWLETIEAGIAQAVNGAALNVAVVKPPRDRGAFFTGSRMWLEIETYRCPGQVPGQPLTGEVFPLLRGRGR